MTTAILVFLLIFVTFCIAIFSFRLGCSTTSKMLGDIVVDAIEEGSLSDADKRKVIDDILLTIKNKTKI